VFFKMFSPVLGPTHTLFVSGCQRLFWVVMWPGSEFDHLPPSCAKINNVWTLLCSSICFCDMQRDSYNLDVNVLEHLYLIFFISTEF